MDLYGIVDVGSNTIVLLVYDMSLGTPQIILHESTPVHLIDYVEDGVMAKEGIENAAKVLEKYTEEMEQLNVQHRFADITEPCRIENQKELVDALSAFLIDVDALSGYEEAYYDYCGMRLSYPDIKDGIAFDVGGGSTELVSFKDNECTEAMSFPYGCVRLSHLPLDTGQCRISLEQARKEYPSLNCTCKELIGIGGTMRAAGKMYGTDLTVEVWMIKEMFDKLKENDPDTVSIMKKTVKKSRQPVFLPGVHMIIEIADIYQAERIHISKTNIREGFLMHCIETGK